MLYFTACGKVTRLLEECLCRELYQRNGKDWSIVDQEVQLWKISWKGKLRRLQIVSTEHSASLCRLKNYPEEQDRHSDAF
jgi:hypothetical protein